MLSPQIINHPKFTCVMSRDGRRLRDEAIDYIVTQATQGLIGSSVINVNNSIISAYDAVNYEKAVLWAHPRDVIEGLKRFTSVSFGDNNARSSKGKTKGSRTKNIDWVEIAGFHQQFWMPACPNPRATANRIDPNNFDSIREQFEPVYRAFVKWMPTDFSWRVLFGIFDICKKYDVELIEECMDLVDDLSHRTFDYLTAIVERREQLYTAERAEEQRMLAGAKDTFQAILEMAATPHNPVDWTSLEEQAAISRDNELEFGKVKLS